MLTHSNGEQSTGMPMGIGCQNVAGFRQLLATCWTDLAIVEVYRGTQKLSKSNVQAWLNSGVEEH